MPTPRPTALVLPTTRKHARYRTLAEVRAAPPTRESLATLLATARSAGYNAAGASTLRALQAVGEPSDETVGLYILHRLNDNIAVETIRHDLCAAKRAARTTPSATAWLAPLASETVKDAIHAARKLDGPPPLVRGSFPLSREDYLALRDSAGPILLRRMLALCWLRAARSSDALAMREGGLWLTPAGTLGIELGQEKAKSVGVPGFLEVYLPPTEERLLRPLMRTASGAIRTQPPTTRQSARQPLFNTEYDEFADFFRTFRPPGSLATPHSISGRARCRRWRLLGSRTRRSL